jgi:hypothetical protein
MIFSLKKQHCLYGSVFLWKFLQNLISPINMLQQLIILKNNPHKGKIIFLNPYNPQA